MSNVRISQLPTAPSAITGTELVPVVQNGQTVQTTVAAITNSPSQTQTFLTLNQESTLLNSRYLSTDANLGLVDGGAQSYLRLNLQGAAAALNTASTGMVAKNSATTVVNRTLTASGAGLSITNGSGVAGDPTFALSGIAAGIANLSGTGIVAVVGSSSAGLRTIQGTANQIALTSGDGSSDPTVGLASNAVLPGTEAVTLPSGSVAQRPIGYGGQIRYNTDNGAYEGFASGTWKTFTQAGGVSSFSAGTTGLSPSSPTTGDVVLAGTLGAGYGGTGASTLTGYVYGNGTSAMTASTTVPTTDLSGTVTNAQLANSAITINGSSVSLGGSITVTATASNALTIGTGLTGTSYNGSAPVTIAIDSTVATLTGSQTLTNKSISGSTNTLTSIPNSALTNSSITLGTTTIALGATSLTPTGLTSVTVTQDPTSALQLATKQYVDAATSNVNYHAACQYATTVDLGTVTYNNGSSGVGATITNAGTQAALVIDGHTFTVTDVTNGSRVLVKNESNGAYNGIYVVTNQGSGSTNWVLTRATDYDQTGSGQNEIAPGDTTFIINGTINASTQWVQTTDFPITIGTTALVFVQIAGPGAYTAGTGLTLVGTQFSLTSPVTAALGGTGITSYTSGDMLYASGSTALSKLAIGTSTYIMTSSGSAPQWSNPTDITVGTATTATNATNTTITANSTNATNYLTFVSATSGNLGQLVNSSITCNPSTGIITGGIAGGTF